MNQYYWCIDQQWNNKSENHTLRVEVNFFHTSAYDLFPCVKVWHLSMFVNRDLFLTLMHMTSFPVCISELFTHNVEVTFSHTSAYNLFLCVMMWPSHSQYRIWPIFVMYKWLSLTLVHITSFSVWQCELLTHNTAYDLFSFCRGKLFSHSAAYDLFSVCRGEILSQ